MNVTTEKIENQQVAMNIEVPAAELDKAIKSACKSLANRVNIPGFRKGKATRQVLERHFGKDGKNVILQEAADVIAPKYFQKALEQKKMTPVTRPNFESVTLEEGKDFVFKATFTPRPEVKLGEYKGLVIEKKEATVSDEDVEKQIEGMQQRAGKMIDAEEGHAVVNGDFVTLDFLGKVDDVAFQGGEGKDYPLQVGSKSFIPGFEDQLLGMKAGEERDVNVTFPEEYHSEELAGKAAVFHCKINSVKKKELPELNDEFAKSASKFETLAELREDIKKNLLEGAERQAENERKSAAIDKAAENVTVEIPPVMVEDCITGRIQGLALRLEQQGMTLEQYLQYSGMDIQKMRENQKEEAEKQVRTELMLEEVAKAEGIQVEGADLDAEVAEMAAAYGTTPKEVKKIITQQGRIQGLVATVLRKKTAQFIIDNMA